MGFSGKRIRRWLLVAAVALGLVGMMGWQLDTTSSQSTLTKVSAPSSWPLGGGPFDVQIEIEGVTNLGSYEWMLRFDPALVEFVSAVNGPFLGSSGRSGLFCPPAIVGPDGGLAEGEVRFGCVTLHLTPPGPDGSGLLSTVTLSPLAEGAANLELVWVSLSEPDADIDIPSQRQGGCVAIGAGASCATPTVAPPAQPTPPATPTPGGSPVAPTATPIGPPAPTSTPTGPLPTPTPVPPGWEAVHLAGGGCQFEAWTGASSTAAAELAGLVGPAGNLRALWAQQPAPTWKGYSPEFPAASDMGPVNLLDVLAICTGGPGDFVRPLV